MKTKTLLVQASARSFGDTQKVVAYLKTALSADVIDLLDYSIGHYSYTSANAADDFIPLMDRITTGYDQIIFITPIYWYTMSGHLKVFFDRLSDLLKTSKSIGRRLRGKTMSYLSVSNANDRKPGFDMPFKETANYLGMHYISGAHCWVIDDEIPLEAREILDVMILKYIN